MRRINALWLICSLCYSLAKSQEATEEFVPPTAGILYPPQYTTNRIVGGEDAKPDTAPYQISLQTLKERHFCGGAIIDERWIITASHCVVNQQANSVKVLTGVLNLENTTGTTAHYYHVDRIVTHCNFNQPAYANDIALLHVNESINFDEHTQAVPYDYEPLQPGDELLLTGWGTLSLGGSIPAKLQMLPVKYVPFQQCRAAHENSSWVDIGHVCTFNEKGKGACHGDSGGPLVRNGKLVALVNWGRPCAKGYPDAHARVSYYHDFIRQHLVGCAKQQQCAEASAATEEQQVETTTIQ